ncbi:MAG: hypothetical protein KAG95_05145 [Bacteroidales bacterium]|nr:hypothetical protein [Bacteroidales bacterium]
MKKYFIYFELIAIFSLTFIACDKNEDLETVSGNVELYLLQSFETVENTDQINETSVITNENPLICYSDFISYDSKNYIFKISDAAIQTIQNIEFPVNGVAFAIKANNDLIYTGYFWPGYSSAGCNWVVIDPIVSLSLHNELRVKLGYPGQIQGTIIPDNRNDVRILEIFRRDNKLIE